MTPTPLSRIFGAHIPPAYKHDMEILNGVDSSRLTRYLTEIEKFVFLGSPLPAAKITELSQAAAKTAGIPEEVGRIIFRLYSTYVPLVVAASDETKLRESLEGSGVQPGHAALLARSLYPHREEIETDLRESLGERFGPTISRLFWRIDVPVAGTEPVVKDPVAKVTLVLESTTDTFDESFEADLPTLDLILEELASARRELAKASDRAKP
jgi:hypothetical protein